MSQSIFERRERTAYRHGRLILVIAPSRNPNPSPPVPDNAQRPQGLAAGT
jgi:hypothetical protein